MGYLTAAVVLLTVETGAICVLSYIVSTQKRKIAIANQIRAGYERKCNTFRMKYTVLNKLERQELIIGKVRELGRPVYIYGGGIIGRKLQTILEQAPDIGIEGILESSELKSGKGDKKLRQEAAVIVTPLFDYDKIVPLLSEYTGAENIIGIDEIID